MFGATVQPAMADEEVATLEVGKTVVKVLVTSLATDNGARAAIARPGRRSRSLHRPMSLNSQTNVEQQFRSEEKGHLQ